MQLGCVAMQEVALQDLDLSCVLTKKGEPKINTDLSGDPVEVAGVHYAEALTLQAPHNIRLLLNGKSSRLTALIGMEDSSKEKLRNGEPNSMRFVILGDGEVLLDKTVFTGQAAKPIDVALEGVDELVLITEESELVWNNNDYQGVYANARFVGGDPKNVLYERYVLTPEESAAPAINAARIFGLRPNAPLLFTIATSGERPIHFSAESLPEGVVLDAEKGRLSGSVAEAGEYSIHFTAENQHGSDSIDWTLRVGDTIALTPPMGWNSWYCWSESVSAEKVKDIARGFVEKGLVDYGWTYVNIDDCWGGPERGGSYNSLLGNERFPDMKGMVDYVHDQGLKVGIYSTIWMSSFAGFLGGTAPTPDGDYSEFVVPEDERIQPGQVFGRLPGSMTSLMASIGPYWLVDNDVKQFAEWGFDYVKYDWNERLNQDELMEHFKKNRKTPFKNMQRFAFDEGQRKSEYWTKPFHDSFRASERDIVLSLSPRSTFTSAPINSKYSNLWRTTNDIVDTWFSMSESFNNDHWRPFQKPGHWNDPDMLQIGKKGIPNQFVRGLRDTRLTPDEQYTQLTLWSILAAPLLISCDVESMDDFTLGLLKNPEVIAISQDPLGKQGYPVSVEGDIQIWVRELAGGDTAVGVFNLGYGSQAVSVSLADLDLSSESTVIDSWNHKSVPTVNGAVRSELRGHASALYRVSNP